MEWEAKEPGEWKGSPDPGMFTTAYRFCRTPEWEQGKAPEVSAGLLVLDDLGREPEKKRAAVEELIFDRWDRDLPTVFTSNCSLDDLIKRYDGRLASRIHRGGVVLTLSEVFHPASPPRGDQ